MSELPEKSNVDPDDADAFRQLMGRFVGQAFDAYDDDAVIKLQNEAAEALAVWALRLLRAGVEPIGVAGALGGAASSVAMAVSAQWALENQ